MASTFYFPFSAPAISAEWLNEVNQAIFVALGSAGLPPTTPASIVANLDLVTQDQLTAALADVVTDAELTAILAGYTTDAEFTQLKAQLADATSSTLGAGMIGYDDTNVYGLKTVGKKLRETISVMDFGANGDGTGDDTFEFNNAILSMVTNGGTVLVPPGRYKILGNIGMKSNVTVKCEDGAIIDAEGSSSSEIVTFIGTIGPEFIFSANATRGDTTISLSGSPTFVVGDIIHLVSYSSVFAAGSYNLGHHVSDNCFYAEWNIVAQVMSPGVYRLAIPFEFPGWTPGVAKAKKVTPITNSHWIGGTVIRTTTGTNHFRMEWGYRNSIRDCTTYHGSRGGATVWFQESWYCEGRNITNHNDPKFLYNYDLHHSDLNRFKTVGSEDCGFIGLRESFGGQSVDFTYSSGSAPYSNIRSYCNGGEFHRCFEGLTSHQGCYKESWVNNRVTECYDDGLVIRGYIPTLIGNIIASTFESTTGSVFTAGTFIVGRQYDILTIGTTNFMLIGALSNTVGVRFVATGAGTGTGTADQTQAFGIRLGYGGARRANLEGNSISGFYGAFGIYGSPSLGEWTNILCNIHDNEVFQCFLGLSMVGIGNTNDFRFITYQNNHHSQMGRYVVNFPEYIAGATIRGNVQDGDFRYTGGSVGFVVCAANCPAFTVVDNVWNRTKGGNAGQQKTFTQIGAITDLAAFPEADWAAQTFTKNNVANWDSDANFFYESISSGATYRQYGDSTLQLYGSVITAGVATVIPTAHRIYSVRTSNEGGAATDDLDRLVGFTNCVVLPNDIVYIRTSNNSQDATIRDISVSGAATFGFQTPGNTSIVLGSTNDHACFQFDGTNWACVSVSITG